MLASGMVGSDATAVSTATVSQTATSSIVMTAEITDKSVNNAKTDLNADVESKVRLYFADAPIMAEVAKCESRFRQFASDGSVLRGKVNDQDVGITQINEYYHAKRAKKLGYDLHTVDGNLAYARLLYKEEGTKPWSSSAPCWGKSDVAKAMSDNKGSKILADNIK